MGDWLVDRLGGQAVTPLHAQIKNAVEIGIDERPVAIAASEVVHLKIDEAV